jgi:hypothetical protein
MSPLSIACHAGSRSNKLYVVYVHQLYLMYIDYIIFDEYDLNKFNYVIFTVIRYSSAVFC